MEIQFPQHHLLEIVLSLGIDVSSFSKDNLVVDAWIGFWSFYSVPWVYKSAFMPVPGCLDDNCPVVCLKIRYCEASGLCFYMNFSISFSRSGKNVIGVLIEIALNL